MSDRRHPPADRRPLASRNLTVFRVAAAWLARRRVSPNAISVMSMVFAIGAGCTLAATSWTEGWWARWWWLAGASLLQLRLLANMFDGMVAIESGKESRLGQLYNEVPDRLSDAAILIGVGYSIGGSPVLGYLAALMASLVAYVRAMGGMVGAGQIFCGPMAKPHRMFVVTVVALYCALVPSSWQPTLAEGPGCIKEIVIIQTVDPYLQRKWKMH